jgi:nitroreductase
LTAGIALQQMSSLAYARGYGAMWRTGDIAYSKEVSRGLGLSEDESIVGFLYLGEIEGRLKTPSMTDPEDLLRSWP